LARVLTTKQIGGKYDSIIYRIGLHYSLAIGFYSIGILMHKSLTPKGLPLAAAAQAKPLAINDLGECNLIEVFSCVY
jgi:hypothetical protein